MAKIKQEVKCMAKVIKRFRDKNTKIIYEVGEKYEGTVERVKELQEKGFLEKKSTTKKPDTND